MSLKSAIEWTNNTWNPGWAGFLRDQSRGTTDSFVFKQPGGCTPKQAAMRWTDVSGRSIQIMIHDFVNEFFHQLSNTPRVI